VRDNVLEADGFAHYADIIRRGDRDVYAASRLYERHWTLRDPDAKKLLRRSAVILIEDDPWPLAVAVAGLHHPTTEHGGIWRIERAYVWTPSNRGGALALAGVPRDPW
jgi:hypothetical protein